MTPPPEDPHEKQMSADFQRISRVPDYDLAVHAAIIEEEYSLDGHSIAVDPPLADRYGSFLDPALDEQVSLGWEFPKEDA